MFHVQSIFESSLRGGDESSSKSPKVVHMQHKRCRGLVHGRGSYNKLNETSPCDKNKSQLNGNCSDSRTDERVQLGRNRCRSINDDTALLTPSNRLERKFSSFNEKSRRGKVLVSNFSNRQAKPSSISSGDFSACSSTDSMDTILKNDFLKSPIKDNKSKSPSICERLHNQSTKASQAKTAQMRYQETIDDDDIWTEYLGREATKNENIIKRLLENGKLKQEEDTEKRKKKEEEKKKKQKRRDNLRKVLNDRIEIKNETNSNKLQPIVKIKSLENCKFGNVLRSSFRGNRFKLALARIKPVSIEEVRFGALNRKWNGTNGGNKNILKDFVEMLSSCSVGDKQEVNFMSFFFFLPFFFFPSLFFLPFFFLFSLFFLYSLLPFILISFFPFFHSFVLPFLLSFLLPFFLTYFLPFFLTSFFPLFLTSFFPYFPSSLLPFFRSFLFSFCVSFYFSSFYFKISFLHKLKVIKKL